MSLKNQNRDRRGVKYAIKYDIKYSELNARDIYNYVGPTSIDNFGLTEKDQIQRHGQFEINLEKQSDFYQSLENSILNEGVRNPILVKAGKCDPILLRSMPNKIQELPLEKFLVCDFLGGSRLYIAQKHNLTIPCIVSDWLGTVPGQKLQSPKEVMDYFTDYVKVEYETFGVKTTVPQKRN